MERGKKFSGMSKPLKSSMSQNFARIKARMDVSGMAQVPIMKLSAPMMKKLPTAATRKSAKFNFEAGGRTGKSGGTPGGVGGERRRGRSAIPPRGGGSHIHCTETGFMKSI